MSAINLQHATCCLSDGISQPPGPCSTIPSYHLARTIAPLQFVNCHYSGFNFYLFSEPKDMETQIWNAGWCSQIFFRKVDLS